MRDITVTLCIVNISSDFDTIAKLGATASLGMYETPVCLDENQKLCF